MISIRPARVMAAAMLLAVPLALAGPPGATAAAPTHTHFAVDIPPGEVDSICPFPVLVSAHIEGLDIASDSKDLQHVTEQDTFSANGHSLTGLPYKGNLHFSGNVAQASGVIERIPLDNGTTFLAAGRVDFDLAHGDWILVADFGNSPDVGEFCAELAP